MVGHTGDVTAVVTAFTTNMPHCSAPNGSKQLIVISGSRDFQLIVWDAATGSEIYILRRHQKPITCLTVSVDGSVLISGRRDLFLRFSKKKKRKIGGMKLIQLNIGFDSFEMSIPRL